MLRHILLITPPLMLAACASSSRAGGADVRDDASAAPSTLGSRSVHATSNPILSDGSYYTTDPAPLVVGDTLYILTGRDTAGPAVNDFEMPGWQMLATVRDPMSGRWTHSRADRRARRQ
jgi:hypothetical protein